jgi:hypothetical protein
MATADATTYIPLDIELHISVYVNPYTFRAHMAQESVLI